MLNVGKALLALFWSLALGNQLYPFAAPYMNWLALLLLALHTAEIAVLHGRLRRRARPWKERLLVLLFGVLHVRDMAVAR